MKIQYCSDLHLEFAENRTWLQENPMMVIGDILLIAGDVYYMGRNYAELDFIKWAGDHFEQVYLIPGNHEYIDDVDFEMASKSLFSSILNNVHFVNNYTVHFGDFRLICTTLWSRIDFQVQDVVRGMIDFKHINHQGEKLTVDQYNQAHDHSFNYLKREADIPGKKIVMTHHLPSPKCISAEFINSPMNEAFCVDKTLFIEQSTIDYWLYGHSHRNIPTFNIGNTKMITNQLGYVNYFEHDDFSSDKMFVI